MTMLAADEIILPAAVKTTSPTIPILLIGEGRELLINDSVRGLAGPEALLNHVAGLMV
jgi:hypothetical protein